MRILSGNGGLEDENDLLSIWRWFVRTYIAYYYYKSCNKWECIGWKSDGKGWRNGGIRWRNGLRKL